MSEEQQPSILKKKSVTATVLNKKLIMALGLVAALILALCIASLFQTPKKQAAHQSINTLNTTDDQPSVIKALPDSYSDTQKLANYRHEDNDADIRSLSAEIASLKQQILSMKSSDSKKTSSVNPAAAKSAIFISGGAPSLTAAHVSMTSSRSTSQSLTNADKQNKQSEKLGFITSSSKDTSTSVSFQQSPYTLTPGTVIPAVLQTKVVSNLPGHVVARVRQNVYDSLTGRYLLIPQGTVLFGIYNSALTFGQSQIQMVFTQMTRPDGATITLQTEQGIDAQGSAGISDQYSAHWGSVIGAAVLTTLFDLPEVIASSQSDSYSSGSTVYVTSSSNTMGSGLSSAGDQIVSRSLNLSPTVTINSGKMFNVMVSQSLIIPPYKR